jgi:hypothetical protein
MSGDGGALEVEMTGGDEAGMEASRETGMLGLEPRRPKMEENTL